MTKQTTNTLLIIGAVVVVYYLYQKSKTPGTQTTTPNSTSGNGPPNNTNTLFGTLGGLISNTGTIYNDVTNSSLIKGLFGGANAPNPQTNSPSLSGSTTNASNSLSDLHDSLNANDEYDNGSGDSNYTVPAGTDNTSGLT